MLPNGISGVLEVDGSSRYFFRIVTLTIGEEVRALPVDDGAGDSLTMADGDCVVAVDVVCVLLVLECTLEEATDEPLPIERLPAPLLSLLIKLALGLVLVLFDL